MDRLLRDELEWLSDRSMPGTNRRRLGDWRLRADLGATGRANTVWPAGEPDRSTTDAVDEVERWYHELGLRPGFQIYEGSPAALTAELDRRGYVHSPGAIVMTAALEDLDLRWKRGDTSARHAVAAPEPSTDFAVLVDDADRMSEMTTTSLPQLFVTIEDGTGLALGSGRATLDGTRIGISAMKTSKASRRTGVALAVLSELTQWSRGRGATQVWLQVMHENTAARNLYSRVGLRKLHEYQYRFLTR